MPLKAPPDAEPPLAEGRIEQTFCLGRPTSSRADRPKACQDFGLGAYSPKLIRPENKATPRNKTEITVTIPQDGVASVSVNMGKLRNLRKKG